MFLKKQKRINLNTIFLEKLEWQYDDALGKQVKTNSSREVGACFKIVRIFLKQTIDFFLKGSCPGSNLHIKYDVIYKRT